VKQFLLILLFMAAAFGAGIEFAYQIHPYERCTVEKGFTDPSDIGECIWLLENQKALR
jgi:hypothetical protein